jgi:hypothetical protein
MSRQGFESARDDVPFMAPLIKKRGPRRPQRSKAELRAEASAAVAQFSLPVVKAEPSLEIVCPACEHRQPFKFSCNRASG